MNNNEFVLKPSTEEVIDRADIQSGCGVIDCNYERVYRELKESSSNYDQTNDSPIIKSDFIYLPNFPSKVLSYEEMVACGRDKYYWDALNQKLYKFKVQESIKPFIEQVQAIVGTEGNPTQTVNVLNEFNKGEGIFNEVSVDVPTSTYILIHGHPEQYAERPYQENIYYYDDVHDKYYLFVSNYTMNKDNWYYDKTVTNGTILKYLYENSAWTTINTTSVLEGDPNDLIIISETGGEGSISIDDINKTICYCDKVSNILYYFDYGQYFVEISYTGVVYERPFEFYRKLTDVFFDINNSKKICTKDIYYIGGPPSRVKEPLKNRYYYDTKNQVYYEYDFDNNTWIKLEQKNVIIPQTFFPHTHGRI